MANIMGYGVSIRNTPIDINKTVAYQEISAIGISDSDIIIDIVRADSYNRPELEKLIETLNPGDRIDMYSIDALLQGDSRKAIGYYSAILTKGIELLICDFSGAIAKLSPFSTLRFGNRELGEEFFEKNEVPTEDLIMSFSQYAGNYKPKKNSGGLRTQERLNQSAAFKEIYYAYESYQIDQATTLSLLKEYCGIENKITFWLMAQDYERTLFYSEELDDYSRSTPEILDLPKRCGGVPEEYYQILDYMEKNQSGITKRDKRIEDAMAHLNIIGNYQVFVRWELLAEKKPKPRKPVVLDFNIETFRSRYMTY